MTRHAMPYGGLVATLLLAGCVVAPGPDYVVAPALPVVVELDVVPYYYGGFYYHYHHPARRWTYSRHKNGPWMELPRDRYPREIRYKERERERERERDRYR